MLVLDMVRMMGRLWIRVELSSVQFSGGYCCIAGSVRVWLKE